MDRSRWAIVKIRATVNVTHVGFKLVMQEVLNTPTAQAVIWITVLAIVSVIGWYVVLRFRDISGDDNPTASELLTNFRELEQEGDISEQEYRTIKTVLRDDIEDDLNVHNDDT